MKKTILAVALMAVAGAAQAQVTLGGKIGAYVQNVEVGSRSTTAAATEPTNNLNITAKEKVGGLTATAVVETSIGDNTFGTPGTRLGDRQMTVGLSNNFAGISLGRNTHGLFNTIADSDVFGAVYGSLAGDVHNLRGLRLSDAVHVNLTPAKGINVGLNQTQGLAQEVTVISGSGRVGPANVAIARYDAGREESTVLTAAAKVAGFSVTYSHSDNKGAYAHKGDLVGVSRTNGPITLKASYGRTNRDVDAYAVGADYHLSKRTDLVVAYRNVDAKGHTADQSQFGFGLVHRF
jgi:predicted porin